MSDRRFEMYEYRQVIYRMRMGEKDRAIARTGLMGRIKCKDVRAVAGENSWLDPGRSLPDDEALAAVFEKPRDNNPTHESLSLVHEERIRKWVEQKINMMTIYRTLVDQLRFTGSYSSVFLPRRKNPCSGPCRISPWRSPPGAR